MAKSKGSGWTEEQIRKLHKDGRILGYQVVGGGKPELAPPPADPEPKRSKYGNKKVIYQGDGFDSILERDRWIVLQEDLAAGIIRDLSRQTSFDLVVNDCLICRYVSDFDYWRDGEYIVEDTKSVATRKKRDYRIKNKLMAAIHGIVIQEILRSKKSF